MYIRTGNLELPLAFYESVFFADWFQEKCPANFRVTFSTHGKRGEAISCVLRFSCQGKHTTFLFALCVFQQILSDVKDDATGTFVTTCNPNFGQIAYSYAMTVGQ